MHKEFVFPDFFVYSSCSFHDEVASFFRDDSRQEYKSEGYRSFCAFFRNVCDLLEVRNVDNILISQKLHLAFHFLTFYHKPLDNGVAFPLLHLQLGDEVREYTTYDEIVQTD